MKTHKILQIIGGGEMGGAEQHVLTLLQGIDRRNFSLVSGCLIDGPFAKATEELQIATLRFPMKHALDFSPLPGLIKEVRRQNFSLIHTHGSRANLLGRLAGRWLNLPVISTVHSSLKQDYLSRQAALLALTLDRLTIPLTQGIITVSEALALEVAGRGGQNIRTIYNGIDPLPNFDNPTYRENLRRKFREQYGISSHALVIGSIARLHPTKGLQYLIQAAKLLQARIPNLHLMIVGEGPLRSDLEAQLKTLDVSFTLTGFLPDAYLALPSMDLFVLPSINEGMGLVLLEAMQAHLPIVATQVGGIPEVISHEKEGLLVPPMNPELLADACQRIFNDNELASNLTQYGTNRWKEFTSQKMLRQTEGFYCELLHN